MKFTVTKALRRTRNLLIAVFVLLTVFGSSCDAQTTTVRPYKFGFTIDEQQHRYEKRDERGIVMGEFGFITADGIYHVTVYATDEDGKFRILAMKNYPYESPPKTIDMVVVQKPKITKSITPAPAAVTTSPRPKFSFGDKACSGCFLPKKGDTAKSGVKTPKTEIRTLSKPLAPAAPNAVNTISGIDHGISDTISSSLAIARKATNTVMTKTKPHSTHHFDASESKSKPISIADSTKTNTNTNTHTTSNTSQTKFSKQTKHTPSTASQPAVPTLVGTSNTPTEKGPKTVTSASPVLPNPGSQGKSNSQVPSVNNPSKTPSLSTPSNNPAGKPGGKINSGIGGGSGAAGDSGDLYRFKYLLDYNGHTETGSRNGNKQGSFYSIGDDNIERTIEYVANEFGFQPRIRWRKLDPNEIKSRENTLKDYEFVWFKQ